MLTGNSSVIVDKVYTASSVDAFPGLYADTLVKDCWIDERKVMISSQWATQKVSPEETS